MPSLAELLGCFAGPITRVDYGFTPERLDPSAHTTPLPRNLMVRGPFGAEGTTFMVPLLAQC